MPEKDEVPILCNYGGNFGSGNTVYEGGTRRLIFVSRSIKLNELLLKVNEICIPTLISSIKYGYPGLSLDASLISILNDDDVSNMMKVFAQSATPIQLYAIQLQSPPNPISTPVTDTCQKQGLDNGAIQVTQRVVHHNSETFTSSSQMVDAYSKDGNQRVLSPLHEDACINTDNPLHDISNGSIQTTVGGLHERRETATSSPSVINANSSNNVVSSSVYLHEEGCTKVDNIGYKDKLKISYALSQGQEFRDANAFDMALREHAIQLHFQYRPIRTDHNRIEARCDRDGCPWLIYASKVTCGPTFVIDVLEKEHTCKCTVQDCKNHRQASMNWIANFIIRNRKHLHSTVQDIIKDIALQYGIEVDYHKARRGKGLASKEKHLGDCISDISAYCDEIERTNPGSLVNLGFSLDGSFGVFIAYHAAICSFQRACRPIIKLYDTSLGELPHIWILASSRDANNEEFLLAYAVTESLTKETWTWFCVQLAFILKDASKITFVTERHKKSSEAVGHIFPKARHRYCRESLFKEFCHSFKCRNLRQHFSGAIFADTVRELDIHLYKISSTSPEAHQWISEISPSRKDWAVSHFDVDGQDYKDWERWLGMDEFWINDNEAMKFSSVISSLEQFHTEIMQIFYRRNQNGTKFITPVTPYADSRLDKEMDIRDLFRVQHVQNIPTQFFVVDKWDCTTHVVDIEQRKCSCHAWEREKFPCSHAVAALDHSGFNVFDYCEWHTVAKYQAAYSEIICPIDKHIPRMLHKNSKKRGRML